MRRLLFRLLALSGMPALFRFLHRNQLTIVLYHGVAPKKEQGIYNYMGKFIEPAHFESQLQYFFRHYTILPLESAIEKMYAGTLPRYALAITFDDGYRNFYEYAFPLLKKYGIPTTMFLATDFVLEKKPLWVDRLEYASGFGPGSKAGKKKRDFAMRTELKKLDAIERERRLEEIEREAKAQLHDFSDERAVYAPLSVEEIKEMQQHSIAFGAHTKSHPILSRISLAEMQDEIAGSKRALEHAIGQLSAAFAYPNGQPGDWTDDTETAVREAGFVAALTTIEGTNGKTSHPMRLARMTLDSTDSGPGFAVILSGVRRWLGFVKRSFHH